MTRAQRKIVVEALIPAPVELVWERTQDPARHCLWDIRFNSIRYLDELDERGFRQLLYETRIGFGVAVTGVGRYLHSQHLKQSTFEFDSDDWKSIIRDGRGIWLYEARSRGRYTYFKTVYDYGQRHGRVGYWLDRLLFRRLLQLATEWGFETLRLWCAGDEGAPARRRSRLRFGMFFVARVLGRRPAHGAAESWLGSGQPAESRLGPDDTEPSTS